MKRKRHSPEQIIAKLREAEAGLSAGQTIGQVCQKLGVSEQTFHRWRNQYGGLKADDARRLKELERENARLKKAVADLTLDKAILKEALSGKYGARRGGAMRSIRWNGGWPCRSAGHAGRWNKRDRRSAIDRGAPIVIER